MRKRICSVPQCHNPRGKAHPHCESCKEKFIAKMTPPLRGFLVWMAADGHGDEEYIEVTGVGHHYGALLKALAQEHNKDTDPQDPICTAMRLKVARFKRIGQDLAPWRMETSDVQEFVYEENHWVCVSLPSIPDEGWTKYQPIHVSVRMNDEHIGVNDKADLMEAITIAVNTTLANFGSVGQNQSHGDATVSYVLNADQL